MPCKHLIDKTPTWIDAVIATPISPLNIYVINIIVNMPKNAMIVAFEPISHQKSI